MLGFVVAQYAIEIVKVLSKMDEIDKKQQKNYCNLLILRCRNLKFKANLEYFHSLYRYCALRATKTTGLPIASKLIENSYALLR
jgi:hypothetical protein